jgi:hypothetical protein
LKRKSVFALLSLLIACALVKATPPDQPNMESARSNLQSAKANLLTAEHNKGGHRAKALNLVNQAIAEVNKGIAFSRRHNHAETFAPAPDQPHMQAALDFLKAPEAISIRLMRTRAAIEPMQLTWSIKPSTKLRQALTPEIIDQINIGKAEAEGSLRLCRSSKQ